MLKIINVTNRCIMNVFAVLYAILVVYVSTFLLENYQKIENIVSSAVSQIQALHIANLWAYAVFGVVYLNIVYILCKVMIRHRQTI